MAPNVPMFGAMLESVQQFKEDQQARQEKVAWKFCKASYLLIAIWMYQNYVLRANKISIQNLHLEQGKSGLQFEVNLDYNLGIQ